MFGKSVTGSDGEKEISHFNNEDFNHIASQFLRSVISYDILIKELEKEF